MPTTTVTAGPQAARGPKDRTLSACVQDRIEELRGRGVNVIAPGDFGEAARLAGRPLSWVVDHLLVLEGIGVLRAVRRRGDRAWALAAGTEDAR